MNYHIKNKTLYQIPESHSAPFLLQFLHYSNLVIEKVKAETRGNDMSYDNFRPSIPKAEGFAAPLYSSHARLIPKHLTPKFPFHTMHQIPKSHAHKRLLIAETHSGLYYFPYQMVIETNLLSVIISPLSVTRHAVRQEKLKRTWNGMGGCLRDKESCLGLTCCNLLGDPRCHSCSRS